jgi:uncharacterized repeat protein (TIGR04076 family)
MSESPRVKITVLKAPKPEEVWDKMPLTIKYNGPCPHFTVGQEIIIDSDLMPDGFCHWAWKVMWPVIMTIRRGGDFSDIYEEQGKALACCIDAARPVSFLIERI